VALQYYRLERVFSGAIDAEGWRTAVRQEPDRRRHRQGKEEKAPLSEIIEVLNERFGTSSPRRTGCSSSRSRRRRCKSEQVIQTAMANPLDKFELGITQADRGTDDRAHGRERQDRHALHGGSGVSGHAFPDPGARDLRGCAWR
jgi:hypothetical protein